MQFFKANFLVFLSTLTIGTMAQGESATNRADKSAYLAFEPVGLTLLPVSGYRGGYYINPNLALEAGYATGSGSLDNYESADKTLIELKAKYFLGNSFYIDGGWSLEEWDVKYAVLNSESTYQRSLMKGTVTNNGLSFHIGNQWQWSGFTLGCDWVGYFVELSSSSSFRNAAGLDPDSKAHEESFVKDLVGGNSAHITRFYLGWAF